MKDYRYLFYVGVVFIELSLMIPFYLDSGEIGRIPLGMSFLADGVFLVLFSFCLWFVDELHKAREEDKLQRWLESRDDRFNIKR